MDKLDIELLFETNRAEAIASARLYGFEELAEDLASRQTRIIKRGDRNPFLYIRNAVFTVAEAAQVAGIPKSTAQAAAIGRLNGGTTRTERQRLLRYLLEKREALNEAIAVIEERKKA